MAHRALNLHRRHHDIVNRQFPGFPGLTFGGGDDDTAPTKAAPTPAVPTPVVPTTANTGPTAGPIINRPPPAANEPETQPPPATTPTVVAAPAPPPATTQTTQQPANTPATTAPAPPAAPPPVTTSSTSTPATSVVAAPATTSATTPVTHTNSLTVSRAASSSAALSSQSSSSQSGSSSSSVGPIIGGVAAGIAVVAIIIFAVTYFLRRKRAQQYEKDAFDASQFRRSAVLMDDPPTHEDTVARGFNSPPMTQHYGSNDYGGYGGHGGAPSPVTYGNVGNSGAAAGFYEGQQNPAGFGAGGQSRWSDMSPPPSAAPLMVNPNYGGHPSPMPSPISANISPYESVYNQTGLNGQSPISPSPHAARQSVQSSVLSRQPSGAALAGYPAVGVAVTRDASIRQGEEPDSADGAQYATQYANYPTLNNTSPRHSVPMPTSDYVELSRSSVTPFQAAQYAAISNKLNAPVPKGLDTPIVEEHVQRITGSPPPALPAGPLPSPFDDPVEEHDAAAYPALPPPAAIAAARRIDSTPPMLPEIHVQSRITSMNGDAFPVTPSPMALDFNAPQPPRNNGQEQTFPTTPSADHSTFAQTPVKKSFESRAPPQGPRPDTVYDPEDAYGGM